MLVVEQQTDRAPIIVSPNNQSMDTEGNSNSNSSSSPSKSCGSSSSGGSGGSGGSGKDVLCKAERSVIVRAGSSSSGGACATELQISVNKVSDVSYWIDCLFFFFFFFPSSIVFEWKSIFELVIGCGTSGVNLGIVDSDFRVFW